jgi:hypothetical protein
MFSSFLDVLRRVDQILQTVDGQSQAQNQTSGPTAPSFQFQGIVIAHRFFPSDDYCYLYICPCSCSSCSSTSNGFAWASQEVSLFSCPLHFSVSSPLSYSFMWEVLVRRCRFCTVPYPCLKLLTVFTFFTRLGIWFQLSMTLLEKKFLLTSSLVAICRRFCGQSALLVTLPLSAASRT